MESPYIIGQGELPPTGVQLATQDDEWVSDPEFSDEFEPAMWLIFHNHDFEMDSTLSKEESIRKASIGVLSHTFGKWSIFVNWQLKWAQCIPPHHMGVEFDGELKGILSPYLTMRTCWNCHWGDPSAKGGWDEDLYYFKGSQLPKCLPAHPCPQCKQFDWFAHLVKREDFQRDAAEAIAKETKKDNLAIDMRLKHNISGQEGMSMAKTAV